MAMMSKTTSSRAAIIALLSAASVVAHGRVSNLVIEGVSYPGYDSPSMHNAPNPPNVFAWPIDVTDLGFVSPSAFGGPDIICHRSATPAQSHVQVAAGSKITVQWNTWPQSHNGPIIDYLANCNGPCETVDKTKLEFFKIDQVGVIDSSPVPMRFANNLMYDNNFSWEIQIPKSIAPGNYVLRHETLALHSAGQPDGAQAYPQCFNLLITGSGTDKPQGVLGTKLYKATDPGISIDIYRPSLKYVIPGPTLASQFPSSVAQVSSAAQKTSAATPYNGGSPVTTKAPSQTTKQGTTMATVTTAAPGGGQQVIWGQCGGSGWTGPTQCQSGSHCVAQNPSYSQCIP